MARRLNRKRSDNPSRPVEIAAPARAAALPPTNIVITLIKAAILVALGIYIYYPSLYGLYLWDDDFLLQNNPVVHDPNGLFYIWTDPEHALIDFFPLTVSVEWLIWQTFWNPFTMANDPQFWQMTFYFHITSLILHIIDGMMIWYLFRAMGIRLAWLGALIFVTHPVLVESVSWMAELKNTIAMPTFILAVLAWLHFERTRRLEYYVLAFLFYLVSMLTKTSGVMFPVIILLYDWWKHPETNFVTLLLEEIVHGFYAAWALVNFDFRRFRNESSQLRWTFVPTIPFFIVAVADAYFLIIYLRHGVGEQFIPGLLGGPTILGSAIGRTACAGMSLIFYFSKCVLPYNLLPIYPQWEVNHPAFTLEFILKFLPWPVMAFGFWWLWNRRQQPWARTAFFGFGFFFLNLLPFVGWRPISFMRFGWVMDHFLYVPILGLIGLAAAAAGDLYDRIPRTTTALRIVTISAAVALVAVFTQGSHSYAGEFVDRLTYWTYECEHNWVAWPAHNNRGNQLLDNAAVAEHKGFHAEASELFAESKKEFQIALLLNPVYTEAHNNLGYILSREGDFKDAEAEFRTALGYTPDFESAQLNLKNVLQLETLQSYNKQGVDLVQQGKYKDAEAIFRQILQYQPDNLAVQQNLSHVLELETTPAPTPVPAPEPKPTAHKSR
jgi:tetratricopeptide (TPR) repeat protein